LGKIKKHLEKAVIRDLTPRRVVRFKLNLAGINSRVVESKWPILIFYIYFPPRFSTSNTSVLYGKAKKHLEKVVIEDLTPRRVVRLKPNLAGIK